MRITFSRSGYIDALDLTMNPGIRADIRYTSASGTVNVEENIMVAVAPTYVPSQYEPGPRHNAVTVDIDEARRITQRARTRAAAELDQIEKAEMEVERNYRLAYNAWWLARLLPLLQKKTTLEAIRAACPSLMENSASNVRLKYLILRGTVRLADKLLDTWKNASGDVVLKQREWDRLRALAY